MTENKRFTRHKSLDRDCTIYDELKDFQFPSLPLGVSEIFCDKLNELNNEVTAQKIVIEGYQERNEKLFNENKQLKQRVQQLENNIEKYVGAKYGEFVDGEVGGWSIGTVNDELLLKVAKEELNKYADGYSEEGLMLGNYYTDCIGAVYNLLVRIYGEQYLETQGIKLERDDDE